MKFLLRPFITEPVIYLTSVILLCFSVFILNSLSPEIFPQYYVYIFVSVLVFYLFYAIGFEIFKYFSGYLFIFSIFLLTLTLIIGQVTRGTVRWIPIAGFSFQASEVVRPFLFIFYAVMLKEYSKGIKSILKFMALSLLPVVLIAIQPSFGVAVLTFIGIFSMFFVRFVKGKNILIFTSIILLLLPVSWMLLRPYQKDRLLSFFRYEDDPRGKGYNTIQSIIAAGSGGFFGRGFKKGFQTQLQYLPEKNTDFVFAGISEELGFLGSATIIIVLFILFYRMLQLASESSDGVYVYFIVGSVMTLIAETLINIGMNLGLLPITGLPLPLISAGGSSLISSLITISLMISGKNIKHLR